MVRNYIRKTERRAYSDDDIKPALNDIRSNKISLRRAIEVYEIPHTTLRRHFKGLVSKPGKRGGFVTVLDDGFETEFLQYLKDMQHRFNGMSSVQVRTLVYDLAEKKSSESSLF